MRGHQITRRMIEGAVLAGRLHREHVDVFRMSATPLSMRGRHWAALLAVGPGALLSHITAAIVWGLLNPALSGRIVHVSAARHLRSRPGIAVHECVLDPRDVRQHRGLAVTSLGRTVLDCAATESFATTEALMLQLFTLHKGHVRAVRATVARSGGHRGVGIVTKLLNQMASDPGSGDFRSRLETRFWEVLRPFRARLPPYVRNQPIRGSDGTFYECDIVFAPQRVIVELDSRAFHDNDPRFDADRRRDQRLVAAGWKVLRITWRHLHDEPDGVVRDLLASLGVPP